MSQIKLPAGAIPTRFSWVFIYIYSWGHFLHSLDWNSPIHVKLLIHMLLILVVTCYNSAFSCQTIKEYNCNHGKRNQILIVKTKLETITSLFIGIVLISKLQGWNDNYVQVNGRAILLCRNRSLQYTLICMFSFAKGDLHCYSLTPHLLPLLCLMFKLLP